MRNRIGNIISAVVVLAAFAAPALAETSICKVTAPEIRVRKTPSKKAHVVGVFKKNTLVIATDKCAGGWVKVSSEDGRVEGYVGGWALAKSSSQASEAAAPVDSAKTAAAPAAAPAAELKSIPTNEQLAIQITEMRLRVLGMERSMKKVKHDIKKIKATLAHNATAAKNSGK